MAVPHNAIDQMQPLEEAPATDKIKYDKQERVETKANTGARRFRLALDEATKNGKTGIWRDHKIVKKFQDTPARVDHSRESKGVLDFHCLGGDSVFDSLVPENHLLDALTTEALERRAQIRAGRTTPRQLQDRCYAPYATVKNRKIKLRLLQIAKATQFLDRGFAEYFQFTVPCLGKEKVYKLLDDARKTMAKMQNKQEDPDSADVGDLGNFCEQTASTWDDTNKRNPKFTVTLQSSQEIMHYLQDALEIPYWEFMVDLFLRCKANSSGFSGDVVLRVLYSAKLDLLDGRRRLLHELGLLQGQDVEDISPIIAGIDARITILDSLWDNTSSNVDSTHNLLVSLLEQPPQPPLVAPNEPPISPQDERLSRQMEAATLVALILLFITAAIIPGYKAFAISMQESVVGSTQDADFWYLVQSSIMAVMGNIIMVVPLLNKSWFSPAYSLVWGFFALGLVFAVISVILYPLLNPGWSSMISFFGSIASVASVLIMTQATARESSKDKPKSD